MDYSIRITKRQYEHTPLLLRMLGIDHEQDHVRRPTGFPVWQILYGVSGSGRFQVEGRQYILREGQIALIPPNCPHEYQSTEGRWILHFLGFYGNSCQKILYDLHLREAGVYHPARESREHGAVFLNHLAELERLVKEGGRDRHRLLSKELYAALLDLAQGSVPDQAVPAEENDTFLSDVISYLNEHYAEDIPLPALAEEFGLTPEYLCVRFRRGTGETLSYYLRQIRISKARILLMERPEITLKEAGELCGFHSPSYFGKVFKSITGMTPQSFRNRV